MLKFFKCFYKNVNSTLILTELRILINFNALVTLFYQNILEEYYLLIQSTVALVLICKIFRYKQFSCSLYLLSPSIHTEGINLIFEPAWLILFCVGKIRAGWARGRQPLVSLCMSATSSELYLYPTCCVW